MFKIHLLTDVCLVICDLFSVSLLQSCHSVSILYLHCFYFVHVCCTYW